MRKRAKVASKGPKFDPLAAHLDTTCCRQCGGPTVVGAIDNEHEINGVRTRRRNWICIVCGGDYDTIEIPLEVGMDLWGASE